MKPLTLEEAIEVMQGQCERSVASGSFSRVTIDSREVRSGDLFFAIKGERFDGHDFVSKAFAGGALAAVVQQDYAPNHLAVDSQHSPHGLLIRVDDPTQALGRLGRYYRRNIIGGSMTVIGVTGSNGKTTTKFMIAHVLSGRWRGHASIKSFNNNIGVPLTLLSAEPGESFLVCEIGMNAPGEIAELGHLVEPDISVVTSVAEAHLERLGSIERIAEEKLSLLTHVQPDGVGIVNVDCDVVRRLLEQEQRFRSVKRVTVGEWADADIRLTEVRKVETSKVESRNDKSDEPVWEFTVNNRFVYRLSGPGRHNVLNALCAIGVARRMGMDHAEIAERLATFELPRMRLECETIGEVRVINDAYNANPASMAAAIGVLSEMASAVRRVMVVGDMRELGHATEDLHRRCAEQIAGSNLDVLIAVGEHAAMVSAVVTQLSGRRIEAHSYATTLKAKKAIVKHLQPGDTVLLKGSRAMGLEALVDEIRQSPVKRSKRVSNAA
jgi:UDP-N-acetylmuramoyl-tripeptide--D-alanyl-D-alanine ligase